MLVDPGHNGGNPAHPAEIGHLVDAGGFRKECDTTGAETDGGYTEASYTWDVASRLDRLLTRAGARVILTRMSNTGWGPCIDQRAAIGNEHRADVGVSIHADGGPADGRGFHVIYPATARLVAPDIFTPSRRLALDLRQAYRAGTGEPYASYIGTEGLDERADLVGLNLSTVPKVFVECANLRNPLDAARVADPAYRDRAAAALAEGLAAFLSGR